MARIIHIRSDVAPVYINDLKSPTQVDAPYEHGQGRYVGHYLNAEKAARLKALLAQGGSAVTVAALGAGTVDVTNVSIATIATVTGITNNPTNAALLASIQNELAPHIVETGDFKLSFDQGTLKALKGNFKYLSANTPVVKVLVDAGNALYA